jgi:hypothetical protein
VLVSGVIAAPRRGALRPALAVLTVVALLLRWTRKGMPTVGTFVWYDVFDVIAVMLFVVFVLIQVFRAGSPAIGSRGRSWRIS